MEKVHIDNLCDDEYSEQMYIITGVRGSGKTVYDKIWSELSAKDKEFLIAIAQTKNGRVIEIKNMLDITNNQFNP